MEAEIGVWSRSRGIKQQEIIRGRISFDLSALRFAGHLKAELGPGSGLFHGPRSTVEIANLGLSLD
jgi:hypothetical protein